MKSIRQNKNLICTMLTLLFLIGCTKFVQIPPPNSQIVTASVFDNSEAVTSAELAIYYNMFSNAESYNMSANQGLLSDELTNYSTSLAPIRFYTNNLLAIDNDGNWNNAYNYIYQANTLIAGLQNNSNISPSIAQQITGEAKFVRAFWHFYLTNMYDDVPLVTTTDYTVNSTLARTPRAQVYDQIVQDLKDAESLLNANYVDATDTAITTDRVRPNKATAEAMLARAYLYTQKYDSAEAEATLVINNNTLYSLCTNLSPLMGPNSVFLANSTEAIWQLYTPQPANENTIDAQNFILVAPPGGDGLPYAISPQLLNSFESGDLRKTNWIGVFTTSDSPPLNYYFPYKYQAFNTGDPITEYTMVLRLAEQYLIRAEARAQQNRTTDALADLNTIRSRAGLSNYAGATDQASLLSAILHERQVELFTEWGHRWFDLKRTGAVDSVMGNPENVTQFKGGVWDSHDKLYPIPQIEIQNDNHLTQNPGY